MPWIEECGCPHTPAYWTERPYRLMGKVRAIPMPHGGVRYLYRCNLCASWRARLFNPWATVFVCRKCMGLRYRSQYIGRRLAADKKRCEAARRALESERLERLHRETAAHKLVREKRLRRIAQAETEYYQRQDEIDYHQLIIIGNWCDRQDARLARVTARLEAQVARSEARKARKAS